MQQVIVIHGGAPHASYEEYLAWLEGLELDLLREGQKKWSRELQETLGESFEVIRPSMPCSENAKYVEWKIIFDKVLPRLGDDLVLIGHSLGGIFLAKYLSTETCPRRIRATLLVAAPFDEDSVVGSLADFILPASLERFAAQGGSIHLFQSEDDPQVPTVHAQKYAAALPGTSVHVFSDRQHFNQEEFPEIIEVIRSL